ncbi:MAG: hypothetical protein IKE50_00600 [Erysipelotrichaceae bacterium]|nr:hypothetical protein [Erysipelotrichaceae bacterium]
MKILLSSDALLDLLYDNEYSQDIRKLLYLAQEGCIEAAISCHSFVELSGHVSSEVLYQTLGVLSSFVSLIDLSRKDVRKACRSKDFYEGLYRVLAVRHEADYIVSRRIKRDIHSTIRVTDPRELRKLTEDGKTDQQRRDIQRKSHSCRKRRSGTG